MTIIKNKRNIIMYSILSIILVSSIFAFALLNNKVEDANNKHLDIPHIIFNIAADENFNENVELKCDISEVSKQININKSYVYLNPQKKNHNKFIENLGFKLDEYELDGSNKIYSNDSINLEIDDYGIFTYNNYKNKTNRQKEIIISEDECKNIALKFLEDNKLLNEEISTEGIVSYEKSLSWDPGDENNATEIATGINIFYYPKKADNMAIAGNSKICVSFNSDGEIYKMFYIYREYEEKAEINLMSVEEAYNSITKGNAYIEIESPSKELIFEKVYLNYWEDNLDNKNNTFRQPVYTFTGKNITTDGNEETFAITVEAVKH